MKVRLDLGGGQMVEMDKPPPKLFRVLKRLQVLVERNQSVKTPQQMKDFLYLMRWQEEQDRKHGGIKPSGEEPCETTLKMSPKAREIFKNFCRFEH
jgi:hypothetical protein